ncbi:T9SS type A sorting domain-containing protein [Winogradskyella sp. Asnod2-B02-A]|uniref:T9SS type A sorting domain-containing protein n=1 Tax=Winogradskyella sp. Asnod2-B02-A TaxID=3160583 RepID=UPI00386BAC33
MNKKIFTSTLLTFSFYFMISQNQLGQDLNGEVDFDEIGNTTTISYDGNIIALGSANHDGIGNNYGHVKIYEKNGMNWQLLGTTIDGLHNNNHLGHRVFLSANGNRIAITNRENLIAPNTLSGKSEVVVYEFDGMDWIQIGQEIVGQSANDLFGNAISLSSDGNRIAIGADKRSTGATGVPYVHVYEYSSGTWTQIGQDLTGSENSAYGGSVSLSSNGNILCIGSPSANKANVYQFSSNNWIPLGQELNGESSNDFFGTQVSISDSGTRLAIGAHGNDGNGNFSGHVRIFDFINNSWVQIGSDIDGEAIQDISGTSVSLSNSGNVVAIGAYRNDGNGNNAGHVRIFEYNNTDWLQVGNDIDGANADDESGFSISLSGNGNRVIIGAPKNDAQALNSGQAKVFDLSSLLSINNVSLEGDILVYPNPCKDKTFIYGKSINNKLKIDIINLNGKIVKKTELIENTIDMSDLQSGYYYLKIRSAEGSVIKPIIKQ